MRRGLLGRVLGLSASVLVASYVSVAASIVCLAFILLGCLARGFDATFLSASLKHFGLYTKLLPAAAADTPSSDVSYILGVVKYTGKKSAVVKPEVAGVTSCEVTEAAGGVVTVEVPMGEPLSPTLLAKGAERPSLVYEEGLVELSPTQMYSWPAIPRGGRLYPDYVITG